jgi:hypothetical protein
LAIERQQEIRRRRKRRQKITKFKRKLEKATVSERKEMAHKLRQMTPGAELIITAWHLEERKSGAS